MLYVDSHESVELELALSQLTQVERTALNPERGDVYWLDGTGRQVTFELKQAGELLGSLSEVEEQLGREMVNVDYIGLGVRGIITPTANGMCQTWKLGGDRTHLYFKHKDFNHSYKGYRAWLARLQECGVVVIETPDVTSMALALVAQYENSLKSEGEHATFKRIIPIKQWVAEVDQDKRRMALMLMSIAPGIGEEVGLALADVFPNLKCMMDTIEQGDVKEIAAIPLRVKEGKRGRTIGPAAVKAFCQAVGLT